MIWSKNPSAIRSQEEIRVALLKLMEQYPYSEITVKQVVLEAKVVRKTFYRNFTSKDDVLDSILDVFIMEYTSELYAAKGRSWLEVIISFCVKYKNIALLLDKNDMMYLVLKKLNDSLPARHDEAEALGFIPEEFFGDLDMTYIIPFNTGALWNVIYTWVHRGMKDDPKQILSVLRDYTLRLPQWGIPRLDTGEKNGHE